MRLWIDIRIDAKRDANDCAFVASNAREIFKLFFALAIEEACRDAVA